MSQANLRNSDGNPYLYLEGTSGATAVGLDVGGGDLFNIVVTPAASDIDPTSGTPSISIDPNANGNIEIQPKGTTGSTVFVNGDVSITGDSGGGPGTGVGNLLMNSTTASGLSGVIEFGGFRFISNKGNNNTFVGSNSGNFSATIGSGNVGVGTNSLIGLDVGGNNNVAVGFNAAEQITSASSNTVVGSGSLFGASTAFQNTAMGNLSLSSLVTGESNIAIGYRTAIVYSSSESNNIVIGNNGTTGDNNKIRIGVTGSGSQQQNQCFIAGINGASVTPVGTVVISSTGQLGTVTPIPMTWVNTVTNTQQMVPNTGYVSDDGASLITFTLPVTSALGDSVQILGKGNGLWTIAQNTSQTIHFGVRDTTVGVSGSLSSTQQYDCVRLICIVANSDWIVTGEVQGNLTVT